VTAARRWARLNWGLAGLWTLLIAPTLLWWRDSVLWVALMSLWANIASHAAAALAARAEEGAERNKE
jgi:hypothetical protein